MAQGPNYNLVLPFGNGTVPAGGLTFPNATKVTDTANGTLQITNSTGGFATLLLGAAGSTTGMQLVASNSLLAIQNGSGSNSILQAALYRGVSPGAGGGIANASATSYSWSWADNTHLTAYTNGVSALSIDSSQNATFSAKVQGQLDNVVSASATTTYTAATLPSHSTLLFTGSTASQTLTLPAIATGQQYTVVNSASVAVSLTTPSGSILGNGLSGATRSLPAGAAIQIVNNGTNFYLTEIVGSVT